LPYQTSPLIELGRDRPTVFSFPEGSNIPFSYELKNCVPAGVTGMHQSSVFDFQGGEGVGAVV
jgi:hypothetical protein